MHISFYKRLVDISVLCSIYSSLNVTLALWSTWSGVRRYINDALSLSFMSQNPSFISKSFLPLYFRTLSPNPILSLKLVKAFYHYISVHCPKTKALSLKAFYHYISVHCPKSEQSRASHLVKHIFARRAIFYSNCVVLKFCPKFTHKFLSVYEMSLIINIVSPNELFLIHWLENFTDPVHHNRWSQGPKRFVALQAILIQHEFFQQKKKTTSF